jgi:hypothetical protein
MQANDPLSWLLEEDHDNPGIRYFALRELLDKPEIDPEVRTAQNAIMERGPVPRILAVQAPDGNWIPQTGKYPKSVWHYQSVTWQIVFLSELGADPQDPRVKLGCEYLLEHRLAENHAFSGSQPPVPSQAVHCMNGHLLFALLRLGFGEDERVRAAFDWQARAIIGLTAPDRYYKSGTCGPNFACAVNQSQPCAWGATKAMHALILIPEAQRSPAIRQAIELGSEFLFSADLSKANFPFTERVSAAWFKFGFPLSYWSDVLETSAVLVDLGYGDDSRLSGVLALIRSKQDKQGRWILENTLNGKMWVDIEAKGLPSKWITLRALRVLKRAGKL